MQTKICTECGLEKEINEFYKHPGGKYGVNSKCKDCKNKYQQTEERIIYKIENRKEFPWKRTLEYIKQRCDNPNKDVYKYYGGRGIKCQITSEELRVIWFRDKAYLMEQPSIDRKDNDGNYTFNNCQYIELREHAKKRKDDYSNKNYIKV